MTRLHLLAWVALLPLSAVSDGPIQWGEPVDGLCLGIESAGASIPVDQNPVFTITAQNVSTQPRPGPDGRAP
jgi:hypothetical protein